MEIKSEEPRNPTGKQYTINSAGKNGKHQVVITEVGAGLRSYRIDGVELLDTFSKHSMPMFAQGQILCPWPNRIDRGRYRLSLNPNNQLPLLESKDKKNKNVKSEKNEKDYKNVKDYKNGKNGNNGKYSKYSKNGNNGKYSKNGNNSKYSKYSKNGNNGKYSNNGKNSKYSNNGKYSGNDSNVNGKCGDAESKVQQLPLNEVANKNAIHGLCRWQSWDLVSRNSSQVILSLILNPHDGYPFILRLIVIYELKENDEDKVYLSITAQAENLGDSDLPYGFGTHPYFLMDVDSAILSLPAREYFLVNDYLIPTGLAKTRGTPYNFLEPKRIGDLKLDTGFTNLKRGNDSNGNNDNNCSLVIIQGTAKRIKRRIKLYLDENYNVVQVFTGDSLPIDQRRRSVAIEPYTCAANAFNNGYGLKIIKPGEKFIHSYAIEASVYKL